MQGLLVSNANPHVAGDKNETVIIRASVTSTSNIASFQPQQVTISNPNSFADDLKVQDLFQYRATTSSSPLLPSLAVDQCIVFSDGAHQQRRNQFLQALTVISPSALLTDLYLGQVQSCCQLLNSFWTIKSVSDHNHRYKRVIN